MSKAKRVNIRSTNRLKNKYILHFLGLDFTCVSKMTMSGRYFCKTLTVDDLLLCFSLKNFFFEIRYYIFKRNFNIVSFNIPTPAIIN